MVNAKILADRKMDGAIRANIQLIDNLMTDVHTCRDRDFTVDNLLAMQHAAEKLKNAAQLLESRAKAARESVEHQ